MPNSNISSHSASTRTVIEKAIVQGKRLRNKIIESIVNNDPFYKGVFDTKHYNSSASEDLTSTTSLQKKSSDLSPKDHEKINTYLKGYPMSREDELFAMGLLKSFSAGDLCKTAEKVYCKSHVKCTCSTCKAYNKEDLDCDIKRTSDKCVLQVVDDRVCIADEVKNKYKSEHSDILKYVDCLRICVHYVNLNNAGMKKLSVLSLDKVPSSLVTYFVEFSIPEILVEKPKSKSKTTSTWNDSNLVRICSRREQDGAIYFKHTSVHDIHNINRYKLEDLQITFVVNCRSPKQKCINILGYATFNFGLVEVSRNLTCKRELFIKLKESSPIVTGTIRVSLQFGCGKLYFGKELIDAVKVNGENSVAIENDDISISDSEKILKKELEHKAASIKKKTELQKSSTLKHKSVIRTENKLSQTESIQNISCRNIEIQTDTDISNSKKTYSIIKEDERELLFGFLYISQAQFLKKPLNSYIVCKLFGQLDSSQSRVIDNTANPVFNFSQVLSEVKKLIEVNFRHSQFLMSLFLIDSQIVPLIYEDPLLGDLRDNFMVIEIFENLNSRDILIGIVKVSLHQFYIAFKNPVVFKYLKRNKLPIIGTDWWEPILNPFTEEIVGQIQILAALGTAEQINNLETERGFKKHNVTAGQSHLIHTFETNHNHFEIIKTLDSPETSNKDIVINDRRLVANIDLVNGVSFERVQNDVRTCEIGVQSDFIMDSKDLGEKMSPTQGMLDIFLNKLIAQKQKNNCVENSTNTDDDKIEKDVETVADKSQLNNACQLTAQNETNFQLRKTSDLLDSLQKALAIDANPKKENELTQPDRFKVHIKIEKGLHLPTRRKCKSKKSRNKGARWEDILPSTYVTFETLPGASIKISKVCQKTSSPCWNFEGDFDVPVEFLINNQKRLIFKVWRKSTNTNTHPHMQTDVVLGFAALDLTVLTTGLSSIRGWFNIVDFSGKVNGQMNISVTPLENLLKYHCLKESDEYVHKHESSSQINEISDCSSRPLQVDDITEEPGELLSRTLKRKFTELDEITQRLRLRLSRVTNDESDLSNDEFVDEFERDINTLCVEDDFNMVNFEDGTKPLNIACLDLLCTDGGNSSLMKTDSYDTVVIANIDKSSSNVTMDTSDNLSESSMRHQDDLLPDLQCSVNILDKGLLKEKQRIDILLEKLTALQTCEPNSLKIDNRHVENVEKISNTSGDVSTFSNRQVSGCSVNRDDSSTHIDTEALLTALDHTSRPNIQSCTASYNPLVFQQIYGSESTFSGSNSCKSSGSNTSSFANCPRIAPDGAGPSGGDTNSDSANP